ncbi:MAG: hypothetical protein ACPGMR_03235 [Pontibacterium sp.]
MKKPYLYKLEKDYTYQNLIFDGVLFENEWCCITGGKITVKAGYAWDGCTPKVDLLGLVTLGVPDGRLHEGRPMTYYASLVHDVLCQFRADIPNIKRDHATFIFDDMLNEVGFPLTVLYVTGVDWFSPHGFRGDVDE